MQAVNIRRPLSASFAEASPRRVFAHSSSLLILLLAGCLAAAQTVPDNARLDPPAFAASSSPATAHSSLTCFLRNALGRPLTGISVEVRNLQTHAIVSSASTGPDGGVAFHELAPGRYEITVAGGILPARREVQVDGNDRQLALQLPLSPPGSHGAQTVSVQQLSVPHKAREALNAATEAWAKYDWKKVRDQATHALALYPDYAAALFVLGYVDLQDGNLELACAELKRAIASDPNSAPAYLTLGSAYNSLKRYEAALEVLSVIPSVSADTWQMHYERARAYIGLKNFDSGLREISRAQQLSPQDPAVLHLGKAHALLGLHRNPEAMTELEAVVRAQPNGPFAPEAQDLLATLRSQKH